MLNLQTKPAETPRPTRPKPEAAATDRAATRQAAQYIADLLLELRHLAKGHGLATVQGLLEIAYYEAFSAGTEIKIPDGETEHLQQLSRASGGGR